MLSVMKTDEKRENPQKSMNIGEQSFLPVFLPSFLPAFPVLPAFLSFLLALLLSLLPSFLPCFLASLLGVFGFSDPPGRRLGGLLFLGFLSIFSDFGFFVDPYLVFC